VCKISSPFRAHSALAFALAASALGANARAVTFGQLDDFQDGSTMGWQQGFNATQPTANIADGGPVGAGDHYLNNVSTGGFGASSRQVMFNNAQWAGDFVGAGVTRINAMLANFGTTTLYMRVALEGGSTFSQYGSTNPIVLPPDGGVWHAETFDLTTASMSVISGTDSLANTMSSVVQFRMLSSQVAPTFQGADAIASSLGVDNARALTLPGDANFDGHVDVGDLGALATNYNAAGVLTWSDGDFTFDGHVDVGDLGTLATFYGTSLPSSASAIGSPQSVTAVPEPASFAVLAWIGLSTKWRRRVRGARRL
jgi:hypothetical protein